MIISDLNKINEDNGFSIKQIDLSGVVSTSHRLPALGRYLQNNCVLSLQRTYLVIYVED